MTTLTDDAQGNLLAVHLPFGTTVQYAVDARNRRIGRAVNGAVTHRWLYQGQLRPIAELDAGGNVVSRFVYGARAVAPEYMIRGGVTYRFFTDHIGSVRLVVNTASGAIAQGLDYDAWGQVLTDTNPGFQPFGYAGGLSDSVTRLVRFGVRDYDPAIGRWLSKDPIGFKAGDSNLYSYVGNDSINAIDPTGLFVWELIDIITFGQDVMAFIGCPGFWTGVAVVVGAIGVLPGVTAIGWADNVARTGADAAGRVVIGENMARVRAAAAKYGAEVFEGSGFAANGDWIQAAKAAGRKLSISIQTLHDEPTRSSGVLTPRASTTTWSAC